LLISENKEVCYESTFFLANLQGFFAMFDKHLASSRFFVLFGEPPRRGGYTMTRTSCVTHTPDSHPFALHPDYINLCPTSHAQAVALQVLENNTNASPHEWLTLTYQDFEEQSLHAYAWRSFATALGELEERGLVESRLAYNDEHSRYMKQYRLCCEPVSAAIHAHETEGRPRGGYLPIDASVLDKSSTHPLAKATVETQVPAGEQHQEGGKGGQA
jgi:hypothetical protein